MLVRRYSDHDDEQWAPVSDLMAVIMLIFMLIAMILFINFDLEKRSNEKRCETTKSMLNLEFQKDFRNWGAILERDLTIRFTNQRVLFESASSDVERPDTEDGGWFATMLRSFFPRYIKIIRSIRDQFGEDEILEIRIEGHTSSVFESPGKDGAFIRNMELSQDRARKILQYVTNLEKIPQANSYIGEVNRLITANGLSSSRLICNKNGKENERASRRVEFKLLTNSCQKAGRYNDRTSSSGFCLMEKTR